MIHSNGARRDQEEMQRAKLELGLMSGSLQSKSKERHSVHTASGMCRTIGECGAVEELLICAYVVTGFLPFSFGSVTFRNQKGPTKGLYILLNPELQG